MPKLSLNELNLTKKNVSILKVSTLYKVFNRQFSMVLLINKHITFKKLFLLIKDLKQGQNKIIVYKYK